MISVKNCCFSYTKQPFMENVSFDVAKGEIFGFLGPSGAGKSTLQKILTGLLQNYSGSVTVNGIEVCRRTNDFYEEIGVDFEFSTLYEKLTAYENLTFFASLYKKNCDFLSLLERVGLLHEKDKKISEFSKGMRTRINFIKSLLHDPALLFLDEPTSGLDPNSARVLKDIILEQKQKGKTVILTTHNMHDAEELCNRVAFIVDGKIKALDTPANFMRSKGADFAEYSYLKDGKEITVKTPVNRLHEDKLFLQLSKENRLRSVHSCEPDLNTVFMEVTGKKLL